MSAMFDRTDALSQIVAAMTKAGHGLPEFKSIHTVLVRAGVVRLI